MMMHTLSVNGAVSSPADGLLLGNGAFSASCYEMPGRVCFQLGMNQYWDRRLHTDENPRPAHIDEVRQAIAEHDLQVDGVTGEVSSQETPRLREICRSMPSQRYDTPCPRRGPTLVIHYPSDWNSCQLHQTLSIEKGLLRIEIVNGDGSSLELESVVHPEFNRLVVRWRLMGWTVERRYGGNFFGLPSLPAVYVSLLRESPHSQADFDRLEYCEHGNDYFSRLKTVGEERIGVTSGCLVQVCPGGDRLYSSVRQFPAGRLSTEHELVRLYPSEGIHEGLFAVGLSTEGLSQCQSQVSGEIAWESEVQAAAESADRFWSRSSVSFGEACLDEAWYAGLHGKRCVLRSGVIPPGLFFPSTLRDFSMWHGDYHLNYNYQSMFLGDYESNHVDTGDAYMAGMASHLELGDKISRDYYGIPDGCFIQLVGYPMHAEDDYFGSLPLGRMAYMTGWVAAYYHRRWLLTRDRQYLREVAYPAVRRFAEFYAGFLELGEDGLYHAFPSNQGESTVSREASLDQPQVMEHAYYALRIAAEEAEELGVDGERSAVWRGMADGMAGSENLKAMKLAPEFFAFDGKSPKAGELPTFFQPGNRFYDWYFGQVPYKMSMLLRQELWNADAWYGKLLAVLRRWRQPNGLIRAMSQATHGFCGAWTESLGVVGMLCDMLLVSDGGVIRLFGGLPSGQPASFRDLRAEGAFLVSARRSPCRVEEIRIVSEAGLTCRIRNPWGAAAVVCLSGESESRQLLSGEVLSFATDMGGHYVLQLKEG